MCESMKKDRKSNFLTPKKNSSVVVVLSTHLKLKLTNFLFFAFKNVFQNPTNFLRF